MDIEVAVNKLRIPENREKSYSFLREILYDGDLVSKLETISLLKENNIALMNDVLAEIVQTDENPAVRMAAYSALTWLGKREDFPVLLEVLIMEEVELARLTMRMHFEIFIEKHSISSHDLLEFNMTSSINLNEYGKCPECSTMIKNFPCRNCGYGKFCSICFVTIKDNDFRTCLDCGSAYHPYHILSWLQTHSFCPVCRSDNIAKLVEE